jgi:glycosyltransferase involved in cell wall biosynthesis
MCEHPKVSVIIPVYNTAPYLRRCLDSVCGQTLRDIEIICINDGSTDNSLEILHEYAAKDKRIRIIAFPENRGAGAARNAGLDAAKGEYLACLDSDDYVDLGFYKNIFDGAVESGAELLFADHYVRHNLDDTMTTVWQSKNNVCHNGGVYRTSFIRKYAINYPPDVKAGQDMVFLYNVYRCVDKVLIVCVSDTYHYVRRKNSLDEDDLDDDKTAGRVRMFELLGNVLNLYDESKQEVVIELFSQCLSNMADHVCKIKTAGSRRLMCGTLLHVYNNFRYRSYIDKILQAGETGRIMRDICALGDIDKLVLFLTVTSSGEIKTMTRSIMIFIKRKRNIPNIRNRLIIQNESKNR